MQGLYPNDTTQYDTVPSPLFRLLEKSEEVQSLVGATAPEPVKIQTQNASFGGFLLANQQGDLGSGKIEVRLPQFICTYYPHCYNIKLSENWLSIP